ncbi:MAG: hypothetical protein ABIQ17_05770 [Candidatus Limnocylindrales bacterium]
MSLVLDNLSKRFGSVQALDGISFTVERGQVFGFLGANCGSRPGSTAPAS